MDLRSRLQTHMEAEIRRTPLTDLGDVMERGDLIRGRRRLVAVAVPAAVVLLVAVGLILGRRSPEAGNDVDLVAAANARLTEGTVEWTTGPATLGMIQFQQATADGVMYVLSTAPGARWEDHPSGDIPEAIYASSDGVSWESHPLGGSWVSSISAANGLLYVVGTAPGADADSVVMQIGISDNRGADLRRVSIPLGENRPGNYSTQVMATGGGVLAAASIRGSTDPWTLLPAEALSGSVEPVTIDDGIAVFPSGSVGIAYEICGGADPAGCQALVEEEATYFATWEELGFDPADISFGEMVTNVAYWSEDGTEFTEIPYPFPGGWFERSASVGDSAVVAIGGGAGSRLFASEDGRAWREIGAEMTMGFLTAIGEVDGEVVAVGTSPDFASVRAYRAASLDGPWEPIDLEGLLPRNEGGELWVNSAAVGRGGVAMSLVVVVEDVSASNPVTGFIDRLLDRGGRELVADGAMRTVEALIVSSDLTEWTLVPGPSADGITDSLMFLPDGTLVAHSTRFENGQPVRIQATGLP